MNETYIQITHNGKAYRYFSNMWHYYSSVSLEWIAIDHKAVKFSLDIELLNFINPIVKEIDHAMLEGF